MAGVCVIEVLSARACLFVGQASERGRSLGNSEGLWYRDSTGWFPVRSQKRHMFPLFSGLTLFLAFAVHLAALAGAEAGLSEWVFLRAGKTR